MTDHPQPAAADAPRHGTKWPAVNKGPWQRTLRALRGGRVKLPRILVPLLLAYYIVFDREPLPLWPPAELTVQAGVALALILAGTALRIWSRGHHVRDTLYTEGPYAVVQHPLYLGTFLISYGVCLVLNDGLIALAYLTYFVLFYPATILSEELSMYGKFGAAYDTYRRRIPSLVPYRWSGVRLRDLRGWSLKDFRLTTEFRSATLCLCIPLFLALFSGLLAAFQTWHHRVP